MKLSIDAVITWVDGSCPKHQEKKSLYEGQSLGKTLDPMSTSPTRFADSGELWYCLQLARKNAPWIRTIYLVTDDQKPSWLDSITARDLGVVVVDHRELFQGYNCYLPTFNSRSIEAMLWNIRGISDYFIYLNDDMFIVRPVRQDDYFICNQPVFRGRWAWRNRYLAFAERRFRRWMGDSLGLVGRRAEHDLLRIWRYFSAAHAPYAIYKPRFFHAMLERLQLTEIIKYKFRDRSQLWPIGYYQNATLLECQATTKAEDWVYISPSDSVARMRSTIDTIKERDDIFHLCIQSMDSMDQECRDLCMTALDSCLKGAGGPIA